MPLLKQVIRFAYQDASEAQTLNFMDASTIGPGLRSAGRKAMEEIMCDYSLEHYRSRPAQLGEKYETHQFESRSIGFIAPGDAATAVCMASDTKLRLEGIPEMLQGRLGVSATENVTFTRLEVGPHHDGVRFANGAEVTLQELGPGVTGYVDDLLSSVVWRKETVDAL